MQRSYLNLGPAIVITLIGGSALIASCGPTETTCADGIGCVGGAGSNTAGTAASGKSAGGGAGKAGDTQGGSGADTAGSTSGGSANTGGAGASGGADGGAAGTPSLPCDGACAAPTAVCDEPSDTCVECLEEADCATGTKKKCDITGKACVECLASTDCSGADAAKCDGGACVKCTSSDDCTHIAGKGVCDIVVGECVQCTPASEAACAGKSCNPATKACTSTPLGSRDYCEPCVADSECAGGNKADPDARCVPMQFASIARNGFCLRRFSKSCNKPYFKMGTDRVSLSGAVGEAYCGIDEGTTRCEAVRDLVAGAPCKDGKDISCGCAERDVEQNCVAAGAGGVCETVLGVSNTCTIPCTSAVQCTTVTACSGAQPYCH